LASLAIPRFTEASAKAKMAEAPRVLASYESAYLAAIAENGAVTGKSSLIFKEPSDSKWFTYTLPASGDPKSCEAKAEKSDIGKFTKNSTLTTEYIPAAAGGGDDDDPATDERFNHKTSNEAAKTLVPNFFRDSDTE